MTQVRDLALRLRGQVQGALDAESRDFVDELIDEVGEEGIAVKVCLAAAVRIGIRIDARSIEDAARLGWPNEAAKLRSLAAV
jgi:sulfur relay (sulfurtransferase) complex TusBCD TusD component (DsrE family)